MLAEIKSIVSARYGLAYPFIVLSVADFEADTRHIYKKRFEVAAQHAGLELSMTVTIASRSALIYYDIGDCYEGDPILLVRLRRRELMLCCRFRIVSLVLALC
jgi:hypothetical protein